jgi:hypothetical protein
VITKDFIKILTKFFNLNIVFILEHSG